MHPNPTLFHYCMYGSVVCTVDHPWYPCRYSPLLTPSFTLLLSFGHISCRLIHSMSNRPHLPSPLVACAPLSSLAISLVVCHRPHLFTTLAMLVCCVSAIPLTHIHYSLTHFLIGQYSLNLRSRGLLQSNILMCGVHGSQQFTPAFRSSPSPLLACSRP